MRIGIDLMGSEKSPQVLFEAVLQASIEVDPSCHFVVFLRQDYLSPLKAHQLSARVEFVVAPESIEVDESPLVAVRRKRESTMALAMSALKEGKIDAFLSTGNTGALIATAMINLRMLPTIERPALLVLLPSVKGRVAVLDVGAGISFKPIHLVDYARMGVIYSQVIQGIKSPEVGLLNIGVEEEKGTLAVKEGYQILQDHFSMDREGHFLGNIEGREVFQGTVDVVVTDGFTGNVFLKTCEGVSSFLLDYLKGSVEGRSELRQMLFEMHQRFNYSVHPGALLCGVDGLVIKCHNYSNTSALISGIKGAIELAGKGFIKVMREKLE